MLYIRGMICKGRGSGENVRQIVSLHVNQNTTLETFSYIRTQLQHMNEMFYNLKLTIVQLHTDAKAKIIKKKRPERRFFYSVFTITT